VRTKFSRNFKY